MHGEQRKISQGNNLALLLGLLVIGIFSQSSGVIGIDRGVNRNYNGVELERGELPFLAVVYKGPPGDQKYQCGASIIDDRHILTAEHCVNKRLPLSVRLGCHNLKQPCPGEYRIAMNATHEYGDIAILRTAHKINFTGQIGFGSTNPSSCRMSTMVLITRLVTG
uniref:Proclotting enzyme n=1 Tax=Aceria tosichella TaxID=561515 RepID=A0A6G1SLY3_9ACAR